MSNVELQDHTLSDRPGDEQVGVRNRWQRAIVYIPAKLYEFGVRLRIALYETGYIQPKALNNPVISVGNLTLGGTGKTPLVEYIARYLTEEGYEVAILTRGYARRNSSQNRVVVSDGATVVSSLAEAGDEPLMMARKLKGVKVIVGKDRFTNGKWLEETRRCEVLVLDDGFQHLRLERDLNILVLDATDPFGGGELFPFGRLREPLYALKRADVIVVTRSDRAFDEGHLQGILAACEVEAPVVFAYYDTVGVHELKTRKPQAQRSLSGQPVGLLCAVGKPEFFSEDVAGLGAQIVHEENFRDHHHYTQKDIDAFVERVRAAGGTRIVTTEKDAVKLESLHFHDVPVSVLEIKMQFEDEVTLKSLLLRAIVRKKGKYYRNPQP